MRYDRRWYTFQSANRDSADIPLPTWAGSGDWVKRPNNLALFRPSELAANAVNKNLYAVTHDTEKDLVCATERNNHWIASTARTLLCEFAEVMVQHWETGFPRQTAPREALETSKRYLIDAATASDLYTAHAIVQKVHRGVALCTVPDSDIRGAVSAFYGILSKSEQEHYTKRLCDLLHIERNPA